MTNNIVSAISRFLTPEVVGKIASASGLLDSSIAQKAVSAAVPSILSGLVDLAARPGGARQIANAVAEQPFDLGSIANSLNSSAQMAAKGSSLLSSLLGGGALGMLVSTVSRFLGIGEGHTRTVMGLLTPVIMGVLGREQRAASLDANGLARMLADQKHDIADAMPPGLSNLLKASEPYEGIGSTSSPESRTYDAPLAAHDLPRTVSMQRMVGDMKTSAQGVGWAYWVLPLLALGGLLWYMLPSGQQALDQTSQSTSGPTRVLPSKSIYLTSAPDNWVSIGGVPNDYVNNDIYNRAGEKLGTIKDMLIGRDGQMAAAVINVGRFLGIGDKDIAVPFSAIQVEQRDNSRRIVIDAMRETLQAAPSFQRRQTPQQ